MFWKEKSNWKVLYTNWKAIINKYLFITSKAFKIYVNKSFLGQPIAEKFYTNRLKEDERSHDIIQKFVEKLVVHGPREKFERHITENQREGLFFSGSSSCHFRF